LLSSCGEGLTDAGKIVGPGGVSVPRHAAPEKNAAGEGAMRKKNKQISIEKALGKQ